ncbi:hypothetical protein PEC18_30150 [Paucibacter sp. O1-1]|nr:hypothetical protein [Paucibacter sp. O1-1]MDA3829983.1 hypothetical protein [Paucibacter sp. O1-1]
MAQTLSFRWLPEIGLWLSVVFSVGVLAAVAFCPTHLRAPSPCALTPLAIPD